MPTDIYYYHYTYIIINTTNQMKYIGVRSCNCLPENDSDYMGSSKILGEAMQETPESFTKTIIDTFPTREIASIDEQRLHEMYDVARNSMFYNQMNAPLGFDNTGKHHSEETRKKISDAHRGEKNHNYGKHHSAEHKKKLSVSQMGKTISPETRAKMSEAAMGKIISPETRKKLSVAGMDRTHSPETRQKIGESNKGKIYERITCPHCSKIGGNNIMKRWHFANCKEIA